MKLVCISVALSFIISFHANAVWKGKPGNLENSHGSIVNLSMFTTSASISCSATKIAPNFFLTAAHCIDTPGISGDLWVTRSSKDESFPQSVNILFIKNIYVMQMMKDIYAQVELPLDGVNDEAAENMTLGEFTKGDIALIEVKHDPKSIPSARIATQEELNSLEIHQTRLCFWGYGLTSLNDDSESGFLNTGCRRIGFFKDGYLNIPRRGLSSTSVLSGDSGGPIGKILGDELVVYGVNSQAGAWAGKQFGLFGKQTTHISYNNFALLDTTREFVVDVLDGKVSPFLEYK